MLTSDCRRVKLKNQITDQFSRIHGGETPVQVTTVITCTDCVYVHVYICRTHIRYSICRRVNASIDDDREKLEYFRKEPGIPRCAQGETNRAESPRNRFARETSKAAFESLKPYGSYGIRYSARAARASVK